MSHEVREICGWCRSGNHSACVSVRTGGCECIHLRFGTRAIPKNILDSQPRVCFNGGMDTPDHTTAQVDDADVVPPVRLRSANVRAYEAQGVLQPGDEGYWQLWGARPMHLQAGDLFCWKPGDGSGSVSPWLEVDRCEPTMFGMKVWTVNEIDQRPWSIGGLCVVAIVRRGTHNMLAD